MFLSKSQMVVVMTLVILTILGAMSLGTDIAMMFYRRMRLQKGADASALSGATYFLTHNKRGSTESGHQYRGRVKPTAVTSVHNGLFSAAVPQIPIMDP
jgi:uncharacterized membrane protein